MTLPFIYVNFMEACTKKGCPVCRMLRQSVEHYMNGLFYGRVNDVVLRKQLRASRGFCSTHARMTLEPGTGDALGVAIIYHDIFQNIMRDMPGPETKVSKGLSALLHRGANSLVRRLESAKRALMGSAPCPACQHRDQYDRLVVSELVKAIHDDQVSEALLASDGLCLPHLRRALQQEGESKGRNRLLEISIDKLKSLDAELAEIIRKYDYRRKEEALSAEADAWRRAVRKAVGESEC